VLGRGAASIALPRRVLGAPFARAARARTGSLLDALLAGRGWIALVGLLLAGIVFFNVDLLQMNRDIARDADKAAALKRQNARLRLDLARLASSARIQEAAAKLGLVLPAPGEVRYLTPRPTIDARRAAKRVTEPDPTLAPAATTYTAPETATPPTATPPTTTTALPTTTPPVTTTPPAATAPSGGATPEGTVPGATAPPGGTTTATTTAPPAGAPPAATQQMGQAAPPATTQPTE